MNSQRRCKFCGKDISHKSKKAIFCSSDCKNKHKSLIKSLEEKTPNKKCKECGIDFYTKTPAHFCSDSCKDSYRRKERIKKSIEQNPHGAECKICGFRSNNLVGHINEQHKISKAQYLELFPNAPLTTDVYIQKLKTLTGEKNPAYQHGGKFSPFSEKFIHKDRTDTEAVKQKAKTSKRKNNAFPGWKEYWLDRGFSEEDASQKVSERQRTFSKEKCIKKHGKFEGIKVFEERQAKWQNTLNSKSQEEIDIINKAKASGQYVSRKEKIVFNELQSIFPKVKRQLKLKESENIKYVYDFHYKNKIIEFNGDYWHCNPSKYEAEHIRPHGNVTAEQVWKRDREKNNFAIDNGYEVLVIWESEYDKDKLGILEKCKNFLM